jgi:glycosyltransferase involved in cell wall biosynthesis
MQSGGEDHVFSAETDLLRKNGHKVTRFVERNKNIHSFNKFKLGFQTIWSEHSRQILKKLFKEIRPDIVHFHNTFPLISPSAYLACNELNIPCVQTLHNFRLLCPNALFFRNGHLCEHCISKIVPWPGLIYSCYRNSFIQSATVVTMLAIHNFLKTWNKYIDRFIVFTEFAKKKFVEGGLFEHKIMVKPNFATFDPGEIKERDTFALYVGRLSKEKGLQTLLLAWKGLRDIPLKIVGEGPMMDEVRLKVKRMKSVEVVGHCSHEQTIDMMKKASMLIFPSECYEGFPLTVIEAFAAGLPVIASRLGAMAELIEDGRTGLHFRPGDYLDLSEKVLGLYFKSEERKRIGMEARTEFLSKYTGQINYEMLMKIYKLACQK